RQALGDLCRGVRQRGQLPGLSRHSGRRLPDGGSGRRRAKRRRESAMRDGVIAAARGWLGTPYRHQASVKGQGADCLGLVRGVWREVMGEEPEAMPPYRPDWAEVGGEETLLMAARRWLIEIAVERAKPGDVLLFRM